MVLSTRQIAGKECEKKIVAWVLESADRGFPIRRSGLLFTIKKLVQGMPRAERKKLPFKNNMPGRKWFQSFRSRHTVISLKKAEYLSAARRKVSESRIRKWFVDFKEQLGADFQILKDPDRVFNMDETSFRLTDTDGIFLSQKGKPLYAVSEKCDKENMTVSVGVSASVIQVPSFAVYKYIRLPTAAKFASPPGWAVGATESGWMTAKAFFEYYANSFIPWLKKRNTKFPIIVFFDGHKSHISLPLSELCRENGIILVCLIAQATHILQPLDVAFIKALKEFWKTELHLFKLGNGRDLSKEEIPTLVQKILDDNDFSATSRNGFRKCGLFPFNPDAVDYTKCTKAADVAVTEENVGKINDDHLTPNSSFMNHFESKIDSAVLKCLRIQSLVKI